MPDSKLHPYLLSQQLQGKHSHFPFHYTDVLARNSAKDIIWESSAKSMLELPTTVCLDHIGGSPRFGPQTKKQRAVQVNCV